MKNLKLLILIIASTVTLSFTFVSIGSNKTEINIEHKDKHNISEPVGGFMAEDKI